LPSNDARLRALLLEDEKSLEELGVPTGDPSNSTRLKGLLEAAHEQVRAERPERRDFVDIYTEHAKVGIPATAVALAGSPATGSAPGGALIGAVGAAVTAGAEYGAQELGYGPVGQAVAGAAADLAAPASLGVRSMGRLGRVARGLRKSGLLEGLPAPGSRAAERAGEAVRAGVQKLEDDVSRAYGAWRESLPEEDFGLPVEYVRHAFGDLAREGRFSAGGGNFGPLGRIDDLPDNHLVTAEDLDLIRREFTRTAATAYAGNDAVLGRRATLGKRVVDDLEDLLARKIGGEESLTLLHDARAKRRLLGEIVDAKGDRLVGKVVVSPRTRKDNAQEAFHKIMVADRTMESLRQLRQAARIEGGQAGMVRFDNDLKRAAIGYLFGRGPGATGAGSAQSAGAVLRKMEQNELALSSIFGRKGYAFVRKNLEAIEDSVKGGSLEPVVRTVGQNRGLYNVVSWAGGGAAGGAALDAVSMTQGLAAGAAVGAVKTALDHIALQFGPIAARNLAVRALFDPRVFKQVSRRVGEKEGEAIARTLMAQFAKRGIIAADDFATLEGDL